MNNKRTGCQFSRYTFVDLLLALKQADYRFLSFGDVLGAVDRLAGKTCLLRHDVDVCMDFARDMAQVESEHGIRATYFVMLRSPLYNLMSRHAAQALAQLISLGHEIGLHFDACFATGSGKNLERELTLELGVLSELVGYRVQAFSFHQPSDEVIRMRLALPDMINTYNPDQLSMYRYISDSNRVWREVDPFGLVANGVPHLHILLHPIWWMCPDENVHDCWDMAIRRNFEAAQSQLLATERAFGPARKLLLKR